MHSESTRQKLSLAERCQKRHEGASQEPRALRALSKRQTSVKMFEKVNSKMPSPASGGIRFGRQKVKFMHYIQVKCQTDTKPTKVTKFFQKKLVKSPEKCTQEFLLIYFNEKKSNCQVWNRRRLWKIVVMDFEVFRIDRRLLTSESFEQFRRASPHICCKSENFVKFACKSILPPSLMAELDRLAKFLSSCKVQVKTSPGSAWYIIPDVQWS